MDFLQNVIDLLIAYTKNKTGRKAITIQSTSKRNRFQSKAKYS